MNNKYALISERLWLSFTIGAFLLALYMVFTHGIQEWGYFIGFGLAGVMYIFRRMLRKRFERNRES